MLLFIFGLGLLCSLICFLGGLGTGEPFSIGCFCLLVLLFGGLVLLELWARSILKANPNILDEENPVFFKSAWLRPPSPQPVKNIHPLLTPENFPEFRPIYATTSSFVREARKLAAKSGKKCSPVEFMAYWPTYENMNRSQKAWYFYWRSQVRQGQFLPTSLSYIFVHVYELINQVGVKDAEDGFEQLVKLWLHYRAEYEKLDNYLAEWLVDYVAVYLPGRDPLQVYRLPKLTKSYGAKFVDYLLPDYLNQDDLQSIPLPVLAGLINYKIYQSQFYALYPAEMEKTLQEVLIHLDHYFRTTKKEKELFERFKPAQPTLIQRTPFRSAIYEGPNKEVNLKGVYAYSKVEPLRQLLTNIVRYCENKLREKYNYRGRLKTDLQDMAILKQIDELIEVSAFQPPQAVEYILDENNLSNDGVPIPKPTLDMVNDVWREFEKMAQEPVIPAEFVPYHSYRPRYANLGPKQKQWYLYWRKNVIEEQYLPTDTGYIALYANELIYTFGVENSEESLRRLQALWVNYSPKHFSSLSSLVIWTLAYASLHSELPTPHQLLLQPSYYKFTLAFAPDVLLGNYVSQNKWGEIPLELWGNYLDYDLSNSRLFQNEETKALIENCFASAVEIINQYFIKTQGKTIFDVYPSNNKRKLEILVNKELMTPAGWPNKIIFSEVMEHPSFNLTQFLTLTFKYIENKLREVRKIAGRLKVEGLADDIKQCADQAIQNCLNPTKTQKVEIDFERLKELQRDTEEVMGWLATDQEEEESEPIVQSIPKVESVFIPELVNWDSSNEDHLWQTLAQQLTPLHLELLKLVIENEDNLAAVNQLAHQNQTMPNLLLDEINELAQEIINDILLVSGTSIEFIDTFYLEMVEQILKERNK